MKKNKQQIKIEEKLFSARTAEVISTLNLIKEKGDASILPLLFKILITDPEAEVKREIIYILNNLKTKAAVPVLAEALIDPGYLSIRRTLACACWQSGLNFKDYLPVFINLVIEEDWETGFEAFTVIENMTDFPVQKILENEKNRIHDALKSADGQKKYFLHEILTLIR